MWEFLLKIKECFHVKISIAFSCHFTHSVTPQTVPPHPQSWGMIIPARHKPLVFLFFFLEKKRQEEK